MKKRESDRKHCSIKIRKFLITDYDSLVQLWEDSGLPHKPEGRDARKNIARELNGSNAVFLVAEKEGCLIASAFGTHDGRKGWINRVAVLPEYRRQGIAAAMVKELENHMNEMGIHIIACLVEEWNKDSMMFFEKMGYVCHKDIFYLTKREGDHI